jgi:hypothetical protein
MAAKAKLGDVDWMTASLLPVTRCEPPEGQRCYLVNGRADLTSADAKRHAFENPGHHVLREQINRTSYIYQPSSEEG